MCRRIACATGLALVLAVCGRIAAAEPVGASGVYSSLTLAVNGKSVAGVFSEARGEAGPGGSPPFSCIFLMRGSLAGSRAEVETWFPGEPERISGTLAFTPEGAALTLAEDHGGCKMTTGSMVGQPYDLARNQVQPKENWIGVGLVTTQRAVVRPEPGPAPKRGPYLVKYDPVALLERREGRVRARYLGGKKTVLGWLPVDDLALVAP